jgi:DnaJ-class molecular chaperone
MSKECNACQGKGYIHTTGHPSLPEDAVYIERCDTCYEEGRTSWTDEEAQKQANH